MVDITLLRLLIAYVFVILLVVFLKIRKIPQEKLLLLASIRMTIQLILAGYVLTYVFAIDSIALTLLIIALMEVFSVFNIKKILHRPIPTSILKTLAISLNMGTLIVLFFFLLFVIHPTPLFSPRYWIPLAGMIIGNAMTGISIGVKTLLTETENNQHQILALLHMGVDPKEAVRNIINSSFESAILPTLNSMLGMGIVFLPGMMSGQIIAGSSPLSAIRYQIGIMLGITGSVSLSIFIFVSLAWKNFFNEKKQLITPK